MAGALPAPVLDTPGGRLAATLVVAVALVVYLRGVERAGPLLEDRVGDVAAETVQAVAVVAGVGGALGLVVVLWDATGRVRDALLALDAEPGLVVATGVVLAGAYAVARVARSVVDSLGDRSDAVTDHGRTLARRLVQMSVYLVAGLVALSLWRVNVRNLLLGAGVVGVVVGLAARQTLGAALAGLVVLFSRPFEVGDWVEIDGTEGVVDDVTLLNSRVRTFDDEYVVVPNDVVTGTEVVNRSRLGRLRVEVDVGVAYGTDVDAAAEAAADAMTGLEEILDAPEPRAVAEGFDDSAVVLRCRCWIGDPTAPRYWRARTAVVGAVQERLDAEDIEIPVPRRDVSGSVAVGGPGDGSAVDAREGPDSESGDDEPGNVPEER